MNLHLLQRTLGPTLLFCLLGAIALGAPAWADDHDNDHHRAHAHRCLLVQYYPDTPVAFEVNADDFTAPGRVTIVDHGRVNWWSNTCHWRITTQRTPWDGLPGGGDVSDIHLQIRYGTSESSWRTIGQSAAQWLTGSSYGQGAFCGIDWRLTDMYEGAPEGYGIPPAGEYSTTVTFTIEPQ